MDENKRKRGPKPLRETAPEQERKRRISVYLNDAEMQIIQGFSTISKTSPPVYIRQAALKTPPVVVPELNQEAWAKLAGAAANLNQLVKRFNVSRENTQPLYAVFQQAYAAGNKSLQALAAVLENEGVVVLAKEDAITLADFRRSLVEARP